MRAIWEISLFHLHRLPSELPEGVTFEELRVANYLIGQKRKFETELCDLCMTEYDGLVHTCPVCSAEWQNVEKDVKGSKVRSRRYLKRASGYSKEAYQKRRAWFGTNDVPE